MAVPRLTDDLDVIQKLSDNPNDTDGLSAAELKARFDEAVNIIKAFLNSNLATALDAIEENANKLDGKTISSTLGIDNSTIPTSAAVRASMSAAGMGDMAAATYDTQGKREDIFMYADGVVAEHNTDADAHNDLRLMLQDAVDRINAVLDSDDETLDELSEIVTYIKSNRDLLEAVTINKVSVADVINNLTTNAASKPLSAAQGVVLKELIDGITPPMIVGVEYRTTERYNGKPVYTKVFDFGALPNSSVKSITHGLSPTSIVGLHGTSADGKFFFPCASGNAAVGRVDLYIQASTISITTTVDWSNVNAYITVKYTKD